MPLPYSANKAAVMVALPSGRLVGTEILAVMLPTMLEFAVEEEEEICVSLLVHSRSDIFCWTQQYYSPGPIDASPMNVPRVPG